MLKRKLLLNAPSVVVQSTYWQQRRDSEAPTVGSHSRRYCPQRQTGQG
ncbi:hypothetical protein [Nostoc sp. 'Peltigera membranacea cyanobiont' 210A]|nr:hypothetical protein [Nostoc sp. 'Peltigera membranacea cyanobiont' 210A]